MITYEQYLRSVYSVFVTTQCMFFIILTVQLAQIINRSLYGNIEWKTLSIPKLSKKLFVDSGLMNYDPEPWGSILIIILINLSSVVVSFLWPVVPISVVIYLICIFYRLIRYRRNIDETSRSI